jgi:hypothetical protein
MSDEVQPKRDPRLSMVFLVHGMILLIACVAAVSIIADHSRTDPYLRPRTEQAKYNSARAEAFMEKHGRNVVGSLILLLALDAGVYAVLRKRSSALPARIWLWGVAAFLFLALCAGTFALHKFLNPPANSGDSIRQ